MSSSGLAPTVLVIDDDPANLRVFARVFRKQFELLMAESGPAAFALLGDRTAAVALVDYQMPGMDGVTVIERLRHDHPAMSCFLLTGNSDALRVAQACATGLIAGVIGKPWDRADITAAILLGLDHGRVAS